MTFMPPPDTNTLDLPLESSLEDIEAFLEDIEVGEEAEEERSTPSPKGRSGGKPFRLAARRIYLTYSQVPEEMTEEDVLETLSKVLDFESYIISREEHAQKGVHFHVILTATKKFDIKTATLLDLEYKGKIYHGHYETVKFYTVCVKYVCKTGNYKSNVEELSNGKILSIQEQYLARANRDGRNEVARWYIKTYPLKAAGGSSLEKRDRLCSTMVGLDKKRKVTEEISPFTSLEQYNLPEELDQWLNNGLKPTLLLLGEGGTGKTCFANSLAFELKLKMLTVTHREDFKKYDDSSDAICFDNFCFDDLNRDQLINALDSENARTIKVKYGHIIKKEGLV